MAVDKIGLNLSAISTNPPPVPNWTNYTTTEFIDYIPANANEITGGFYGIFVLMVVGIFLLWLLTDRGQFGQFRYSYIRGFGISMGIVLMFAIRMLEIGYIVSFIHIGYLMGFYMLMNIYVLVKNPN